MTEPLFRDDAYLRETAATVLAIDERGGVILDRTVFYAQGGGQPGDRGEIVRADGAAIAVVNAVYGEDRKAIAHLL
ncbi:MAG: alanyl-tRNA editing protein, partial [Methylobacteriaceae bacterium]|nr:alanyl-tRNA editing protein [Methylobacteriaceae bacterium]